VPDDAKKSGHIVEKIDAGAAAQKGVSSLRESQNPTKPEGLSRPAGVIVPPVGTPGTQAQGAAPQSPAAQTQGNAASDISKKP
jgi:hypothetical protein